MIDGIRFSDYLDEANISAEDFWLLYRIMLQEPLVADILVNVKSVEKQHAIKKFSMQSLIYQEKHRYYNGEEIDWAERCRLLEDQGFLEIWGNSTSTKSIQMKDLRVTDKFKKNFFSSDLDNMVAEIISIYPKEIIVSNEHGTKHYKTNNLPYEVLKDKYNTVVLKGGDKQRHYRFLAITETFLQESGSRYGLYGLDKYLDLYESIAVEIEARGSDESHDRYESL